MNYFEPYTFKKKVISLALSALGVGIGFLGEYLFKQGPAYILTGLIGIVVFFCGALPALQNYFSSTKEDVARGRADVRSILENWRQFTAAQQKRIVMRSLLISVCLSVFVNILTLVNSEWYASQVQEHIVLFVVLAIVSILIWPMIVLTSFDSFVIMRWLAGKQTESPKH